MNATTATLGYWTVTAWAALNVVVCLFVVRRSFYSRAQKIAQCMIVWLLPFLGAFAVGLFLYGQRDNPIFNTRAFADRKAKGVWAVVEPTVHEPHGHSGAEH